MEFFLEKGNSSNAVDYILLLFSLSFQKRMKNDIFQWQNMCCEKFSTGCTC